MPLAAEQWPNRLKDLPFEEWVPSPEKRAAASPNWINLHAHHDTNPWNWDGLRVAAELMNRGVSKFGIVAFDNGAYIDSIAALARYLGEPIPCFIEALVLTPEPEASWNDLPGRMYVQAGPFFSSAEAQSLSDALVKKARRRAEYQAAKWNEGLDLGFEYLPDWESLELRGVTEANLSRDIVEAIQANSPDPSAIWKSIPELTADPADDNFARAFRNATMVTGDAVARVPRNADFYLSSREFAELAGNKAHYMYVGKTSGAEADRRELLHRMQAAGFPKFCAIPQRNVDAPDKTEDFAHLQEELMRQEIPALYGTELNAHGQWWHLDLSQPPFAEARDYLEANMEGYYST
jgi:hypothetical protein